MTLYTGSYHCRLCPGCRPFYQFLDHILHLDSVCKVLPKLVVELHVEWHLVLGFDRQLVVLQFERRDREEP